MSSQTRPRYDLGMTNRVKIAVSLRADQVAAARLAVDTGRAASVSAYVGEAIDDYWREEDSVDVLLREMADKNGPLTDADYAWADRALQP